MSRPHEERPSYGYQCEVCSDGQGFYARPCPGCYRQRGCDIKHAKVYRVHVGERVTLPGPEVMEERREAA